MTIREGLVRCETFFLFPWVYETINVRANSSSDTFVSTPSVKATGFKLIAYSWDHTLILWPDYEIIIDELYGQSKE